MVQSRQVPGTTPTPTTRVGEVMALMEVAVAVAVGVIITVEEEAVLENPLSTGTTAITGEDGIWVEETVVWEEEAGEEEEGEEGEEAVVPTTIGTAREVAGITPSHAL